MVRAYDSSHEGTADLVITPSGAAATTEFVTFTAGYKKLVPNFTAGTRFMTIEEQGGSSDTVMLVVSKPDLPLAMDDDSGIGYYVLDQCWVQLHDLVL